MARETRAAREARELKEAEEYTRERASAVRAAWHRRISLLLLTLRNDHEVTIEFDDEGWVKIHDDRDFDRRFWATPFFPLDLLEMFDDTLVLHHDLQLERAEELAEELTRERREWERKEQLRRDALAKLSAEEREVLGL